MAQDGITIEKRNNLIKREKDVENALEFFKELEARNKPTLKWVLSVEKIELWLPRVITSLALIIFISLT